jgi:UDP-N-acetylmuramate dehydrogenase
MSKHTTFHIGGRARVFITPKNLSQTQEIYRLCHRKKLPIYILGKGSNILVKDKGIKSVVIKPEWQTLKREGNKVTVSSAYPLSRLVNESAKMGLSGLEPLAGIPGTVGGAVVMNAGGKYGQIADVIESVQVINKNGMTKTFRASKGELYFDYRYSNLRNKLVSEVSIKLKLSTPEKVRRCIKEILTEKKRTQPLNAWSAGCVFKNQPCYSVGALIDQAGLKGTACGGAKVSTKHANFIVNTGNAKAKDVLGLIDIIKRTVCEKFKVNLKLEIERW